MDRRPPTDNTVLRVLADLVPAKDDSEASTLDVLNGQATFAWLSTVPNLPSYMGRASEYDLQTAKPLSSGLDRRTLDVLRRLNAVDVLHSEERLLRMGWVFLVGTIGPPEDRRRVFHPLITLPIRLRTGLNTDWEPAGELELSPLVPPARRVELEAGAPSPNLFGWEVSERSIQRFPTLTTWIRDVVTAMGFDAPQIRGTHPSQERTSESLVACVGFGIYLGRDIRRSGLPTALRNWAGRDLSEGTSFTHLLGVAEPPRSGRSPAIGKVLGGLSPRSARSSGSSAPAGSPWSASGAAPTDEGSSDPLSGDQPPVRLSESQAEAVRRSRSAPVTVVSGPPGSGKSYAACAIALDAVARGERVLMATQTIHASEVLTAILESMPGPDPVVFGGNEAQGRLRAKLAEGLDDEVPAHAIASLRADAETAHVGLAAMRRSVSAALDLERSAARLRTPEATVELTRLRSEVPGAFSMERRDADLGDLRARLERAGGSTPSLWGRWRASRAERSLRRELDVPSTTPLHTIGQAIDRESTARAVSALAVSGGTHLEVDWQALVAALSRHRRDVGAWISATVRSGAARDERARRAVGELATSLRRVPSIRRESIGAIDSDALLSALPLWVGTLRDIEDMLPARPGTFDLVVLDEASQIDLPNAAPALLRAGRAVVVGDPHQLRHVSFISDEEISTVLARHDLLHRRDRLDVRRLSAFDTAAAAAPIVRLDEHHRSVPHLIEFSAKRFYDGALQVATRHPRNESTDVIDVVHVAGTRDDGGVNRAELEAVEQVLRRLEADGAHSVGVVTPLRAQADAIEAMVLDRFDLATIERLGMRTGTVHAFQGAEREVTVISTAVEPGAPAGSLRFVEDPNLFNVMVTRARGSSVVVTSFGGDAPWPPAGLLADYLRHAENPPGPQRAADPDDPWVAALAAELRRAGVLCRPTYPVGRWTVDLCVGEGEGAAAIECRVHEDGVDAHIARHLQLREAGWRFLQGWPTRFDHDPVRAAVVLVEELRHPR